LKSDERQRLNPNHRQAKGCPSVTVRVAQVNAPAEVCDHLDNRVVAKRGQDSNKALSANKTPIVGGLVRRCLSEGSSAPLGLLT
jgi:hypothetical protein